MSKGKFENKDLLHYHLYLSDRSSTPTKNILSSFTTGQPDIKIAYEFVSSDLYEKIFKEFLHNVLSLNLNIDENLTTFISHYDKMLMKYQKLNISTKNLVKPIKQHLSVHDSYCNVVKAFQSNCKLRFAVCEGLHRTYATLSSFYINYNMTNYMLSTNPIVITVKKDPSTSNGKIIQTLKKTSKTYNINKEKTFKSIGLDNLRELFSDLYKKGLFADGFTFQWKLQHKENFNVRSFKSRNELYIQVRSYLIAAKKKGKLSGDFVNTLIVDNKGFYTTLEQEDGKERNFTEFDSLVNSFHESRKNNMNWKDTSSYSVFDMQCIKKQFIHSRKSGTHKVAFFASEVALVDIFFHAARNKKVFSELYNVLFQQDEKPRKQLSLYTSDHQKVTKHTRSYFDLDTISKFETTKTLILYI